MNCKKKYLDQDIYSVFLNIYIYIFDITAVQFILFYFIPVLLEFCVFIPFFYRQGFIFLSAFVMSHFNSPLPVKREYFIILPNRF